MCHWSGEWVTSEIQLADTILVAIWVAWLMPSVSASDSEKSLLPKAASGRTAAV
jgi:hypothetical protein